MEFNKSIHYMYLQYSVITFSLEKKSNPFSGISPLFLMTFLNIFLFFWGVTAPPPIPAPTPLVNIFSVKKMVSVSEPVVHKRGEGWGGGIKLKSKFQAFLCVMRLQQF